MEKDEQELDHDAEPVHPNSTPSSETHSPPREPELEPIRLSQNLPPVTLPPRRELELQPIGLSPNRSTQALSPRSERESEPASQSPPLKMHSPSFEQPRYSSSTESPTTDFSRHEDKEEEEQNQKQNSFKPQSTASPDSVPATATKVGPVSREVEDEKRVRSKNAGSRRRFSRPNLTILKRANRDNMIRKSQLGFRVCGFVFCLVSFSVLAADKEQGWTLDSFNRYKEFRYCMTVNVIAFAYSGFQSYYSAYQLTAGEGKLRQDLCYYLDFSLDQILTYLLLSASSSAAVRVDDWQSNWGKDEFPDMAKAAVALSFLAFVALGFSSLISGCALYTLKSI